MPTFDVVLHTNSGMFRDGAQQLLESSPPVKDRIEMGQGLWLARLDGDLAKALMDTCEPKVLGVPAPVRRSEVEDEIAMRHARLIPNTDVILQDWQ